MEMQAEIVIVGAGIAGLATAVGLHRLGLRALLLEASNDLRVTGFAFTSWSNAWKALDALGIGDLLREKRPRQQTLTVISAIYGITTSQFPLISTNTCKGERDYETRCLERKMLVQILANELPKGSIKFSSKVVSIEESVQHKKLLHLVDGSIIETKVLIGCDGINSVVGRWLGLKKPQRVGQSTIRGHVRTPIERRMTQFIGDGVKYGIAPIDDNSLYWFLTFIPSTCDDKEVEEIPVKMKGFVLSKLGKASEKVRELVEKTNVNDIICSPIKFRLPWEALWGEITRDNVCVAGDAFHPMTPDLGQGACSSLEDGVILARCLGRAMLLARQDDDPEKEYMTIKKGLDNYAKQRRWRAFALTTTAYLVGYIELASSKSLQFLRDYVLTRYLNRITLKMTNYDCGRLI